MTRSGLAHSVQQLPTTAAKIRALAAQGHARAEIARALGIRYQHVRNVLLREEAKSGKKTEPDASPSLARDRAKVRVGPDRRIAIPLSFTEELGVKEGDVLFARIEDGEIRLLTVSAAVRKAQAMVRQFVPEGVSLVDELLEDRRREVERERNDG